MRLSLLFFLAALLSLPTAQAQLGTCSTSWASPASGDWNVAANWDNGVPTAASDACITAAGTYTVTKTAGALSVATLALGGASGAQTLVVSQPMTLDSDFEIGANGVLEWTANYLEAGTLTNTGLIRLIGGTASRGVRGATAVLRNEGTVEHSDNGFFYVYNGARAENAALWQLQDTGDLLGFTGTGRFVNEAGATFEKTNAGLANIGNAGLTFENAGTIDVLAGELDFDVPSTHTDAVLTTAAGSTLRFSSSAVTFTGAISGAQAGALRLEQSFSTGAGTTWAFTGTGIEWTANYLESGTLTNTGLIRLIGGTASRGARGATAVLRNEGTVEHSNNGFFYVYNGARAENAALWQLQDTGRLLGFTGTGRFVNEAGALFEKTNAGLANVGNSGLTFQNDGTVSVLAGELDFDVPSIHTDAVLTTAAGSTLRFSSGLPTFAGTVSGAQSGVLRTELAFAAVDAELAFTGTGIEWTANYLESGTLTNTGLIRLAGGTASRGVRGATAVLRNEGTVEHSNNGFFYVYNGARAENAALWQLQDTGDLLGFTGTGLFVNEASATFEKTNVGLANISNAGLTFQNDGTVSVLAGELDVDVPFDHQAGALIQGDGTFDITNSSPFTFDGDVAPGSMAPGLLTWQTVYAPVGSSALRVEIGGSAAGTDYDQLAVSGAATLAGTLAVEIAAGQAPEVGDSFTVLTASSVSGTFASVVEPSGYGVSVAYTAASVVVTVTRVDPICSGTVVLASQADVDGFSCATFTGDLAVQGSGITGLGGLSGLSAVSGSFAVGSTSALADLSGLGALQSVGGDLSLGQNTGLTNVDALAALMSIGGGLAVQNNPALARCAVGLGPILAADRDDDSVIGGASTFGANAPGGDCNSAQSVLDTFDPPPPPPPTGDFTGALAYGTCPEPPAALGTGLARCRLDVSGTNGFERGQRYTVFLRLDGPGGFSRIAFRGEIKPGGGGSVSQSVKLQTKRSDPDGAYTVVLLAELGSVRVPGAGAVELATLPVVKGGGAGLRVDEPLAVFPNPAAERATVRFALPEAAEATLVVYDALGREVARLVDGPVQGLVTATLDADSLPAGLYVARLNAGDRVETVRLTVVR